MNFFRAARNGMFSREPLRYFAANGAQSRLQRLQRLQRCYAVAREP